VHVPVVPERKKPVEVLLKIKIKISKQKTLII
jgi:hypothetical protein